MALPTVGTRKAISTLETASALGGDELLAVVQDSTMRKTTIDDVRLYSAAGATTARPALASTAIGYQWFDTTLGKPIWWTGTAWKDAAGVAA